jgi:hypothetical protein
LTHVSRAVGRVVASTSNYGAGSMSQAAAADPFDVAEYRLRS